MSHCTKKSNLSKAHKTHDSLSSSHSQIVLVYLQPFRRSLLKRALQPKIAEKSLKPPIKGIQGHQCRHC